VAKSELSPLLQAYRHVNLVDVPALVVGGFAAALGHRWGAFVLLANVVVQIGAHAILGSVAYRDVIARPWPKVAPPDDNPWDD
jgi:hypothetical protein